MANTILEGESVADKFDYNKSIPCMYCNGDALNPCEDCDCASLYIEGVGYCDGKHDSIKEIIKCPVCTTLI